MKIRNLYLALPVAILLTCCTKADPKEEIIPQTADYVGTVTVLYQGSPFENENIEVNFTPNEDGSSASITIHKIRFVPQMPVTIDVTIPNVNLSVAQDAIILQCDNVVPLAMGGEYPRYTVTALSGSLKGDELEFSLNFGDYPTSFQGVQTKGTAQILLPRQLPL